METCRLETPFGTLLGEQTPRCRRFLGVPFARAARFAYAELLPPFERPFDATRPGPGCPQNRAVHEHLENATRRFYKREYRDGMDFRYSEDCLNLNLYLPLRGESFPLLLFFYGGGFDSGLNCESPFDGEALAARGIGAAFANYRVGPLGYLTHEQLRRETGRDGNFGLDDQLAALRWLRRHAAALGGDADNITLMGQSAGAISVQLLCLSPQASGLFRRAVMLSGAGRFPRFAQPRPAERTHGYWARYIELAGCRSLDELREAPLERLFEATERIRAERKDNQFNTMPVVDGFLLPDTVDRLIRRPDGHDALVSYTNNDMYAPLLARMGNAYARRNGAYVCYFDLDAPGDGNAAFHSADLRYWLETLSSSWRPYGARDYEAASQLGAALANFARSGDPNGPGVPRWEKAGRGLRTAALRVAPEGSAMGRADYRTLTANWLGKGDPKG